jgi:hemerythrin
MFQYDGNLVKDELCSTILTHKLPLTKDFDEA